MPELPALRKIIASNFSRPIAGLLARTPLTPNFLTWFGFLLVLGAAWLIAAGYPFAGGWAVLGASLFDTLDGALARLTNRVTKFGAFLDSTLDRLADAAILFAIIILGLQDGSSATVLLACLALIGSLLVSYARARAEAVDLKGEVGILTRAERIGLLVLGLLLNQIDYALIVILGIVTVLSFVTVAQRIIFVWQQTRSR